MKRKHKKILLNYIFDDDLLDTKDYIENEVSDNITKNPMAYKSIFDKLYEDYGEYEALRIIDETRRSYYTNKDFFVGDDDQVTRHARTITYEEMLVEQGYIDENDGYREIED